MTPAPIGPAATPPRPAHAPHRAPAGPAARRPRPDSLAAGTPEPLRSRADRAARRRARARARDRPDRVRLRREPLPAPAGGGGDGRTTRRTSARCSPTRASTGIAVNFRGGGTSLSGQGGTDGILIDVRRWFSGVRIEDGGARARIRAGTLLGLANRLLARHGCKLGPDPASKDIATLGGVIANNSGGMRCGVTWDPYSTVESMTLVLASGTVIDTAAPDAEAALRGGRAGARAGPARAPRGAARRRASSPQRVRRKYEIKNVTGYRLCALLDADTPLEIFRRLVVGSEGTLAFIAEAVMRTRPEPKHDDRSRGCTSRTSTPPRRPCRRSSPRARARPS